MIWRKSIVYYTKRMVYLFCFCPVFFMYCKTPFATREPEPPKTPQSSWIQPTSPNYVTINLSNAVAERNTSNYLRCLADINTSNKNFLFIPEPSVHVVNPGLFTNWDIEDERNYLNQLMLFLTSDSVAILNLSLLRENAYQDSVIMVYDYVLTIKHKQQSADCPGVMKGQVEYRLIRSPDDLWYIHRWTDFATSDDPTWSSLRACFGK